LNTENIKKRKTVIGIIGLGYVGLPLSIRFSQENFKTVGFDIDEEKVNILNSGKSYIKHIDENNIRLIINKGFKATSDFNEINEVDVIIICVPTPLDKFNKPDLSYIHSTLKNIKNNLKENQLLILESTTYPGTTEEEIVPLIEKNTKLIIGKNFFVGYSPEREDPGNKYFSTKTIPKVISGVTENCKELTNILYKQIVDETVPVKSPKVAEMTKILENIHRAVNIGLVNELKMVADKMDIDIYEVIRAASTKPFGFTAYYPGPGLGGHCIPIDPFYLSWKAKQIGVDTRFIELAGEINSSMPNYVINRVTEVLKGSSIDIKGSKILVLGLSYKKNVDDTRESPSFVIIDLLIKLGAKVEYSDPYLPVALKTRKYNFKLESIPLDKKSINSFDLIILSTDHDLFDYKLIKRHAKLIVDTRGKFEKSDKVFSS
tara:strand:+ start:10005 stop:11300 length:1296 start_codon:yes stop_codon:yes gene_type:complete